MRNPIKVAQEKYQATKQAAIEIYEEDKLFYAFLAGSAMTSATTIGVLQLLKKKGLIVDYNPLQPLPGVNLTDYDLRRELLTGIMVGEYLTERGLTRDMVEFSKEWSKQYEADFAANAERAFTFLSRVPVKLPMGE